MKLLSISGSLPRTIQVLHYLSALPGPDWNLKFPSEPSRCCPSHVGGTRVVAEIRPMGMCLYCFLFAFNRCSQSSNSRDDGLVLASCFLLRGNGLCFCFCIIVSNLLFSAFLPLYPLYYVAWVRIGIGFACDDWHDRQEWGEVERSVGLVQVDEGNWEKGDRLLSPNRRRFFT